MYHYLTVQNKYKQYSQQHEAAAKATVYKLTGGKVCFWRDFEVGRRRALSYTTAEHGKFPFSSASWILI